MKKIKISRELEGPAILLGLLVLAVLVAVIV